MKGRKTGGRVAGVPNKAEHIRTALMAAFDKVGGAQYLEGLARTQPAVFCHLLGKVLPHELATSAGALRQEVVLKWMTPEMAKARGYLETPMEEETPGSD